MCKKLQRSSQLFEPCFARDEAGEVKLQHTYVVAASFMRLSHGQLVSGDS